MIWSMAPRQLRFGRDVGLQIRMLLRVAGELNAFFIVPARAKSALRSMLSTHPPMAQPVAALARLQADLQHSRPTSR